MRALIHASVLMLACLGRAAEPPAIELSADWTPSNDSRRHEDWTFNTWRNQRGDLLTVALNGTRRELNSYGDLDRAMDFATSAYPAWLEPNEFRAGLDDDDNPRFLKLQSEPLRIKGNANKWPHISYVMVNDNGSHSFMAVGAVICVGNETYYVQHSTSHHVDDILVDRIVRQLVQQSIKSTPQ